MGFDWKIKARENVGKYAWAIVIAVLKEIGEVAMNELAAGLEEFRKQGKTPDGWTKEEYLSYAIGRLKLVQAREIGPWGVDDVIDWAIGRLIDVLEGKLDDLDSDPPNDDDQPPAEPPKPVTDPYYPTKYGPDADIDYSRLRAGDKVYKKELDRFVIPGLFANLPLYRQAVVDATLIDVIEQDGANIPQ